MHAIEMPIEDELDLHRFSPKEIPDLLDDYLGACVEKGIFELRIIHGKGKGMLKARVRRILSAHRLVKGFKEAPPEAGGWGATLVELRRRPAEESVASQ